MIITDLDPAGQVIADLDQAKEQDPSGSESARLLIEDIHLCLFRARDTKFPGQWNREEHQGETFELFSSPFFAFKNFCLRKFAQMHLSGS